MRFRSIHTLFALLLIVVGALPAAIAGAATPIASIASPGDENVAVAGHLGGQPKALFIRGTYAYVGMGPELAVLDIATPSRPARVGYVVLPQSVSDVAVSGSYAYVAAGSAGLRIVDISDPAHPAEVGHYSGLRDAGRVVVAGNFAYLVDATVTNDQDGLHIVNIANPAEPVRAGFYHVAIGDPMYGSAYLPSLGMVGGYAYVGWTVCSVVGANSFCQGGLYIVDVSTPGTPINLGAYGPFYLMARGITIVGSYLYLAAGRMGLRVLDISKPEAPVEVGAYEIDYYSGDHVYDVAVAGDLAYVANGSNGIITINVGNPAAPVKLRDISVQGSVERIAATTSYAYVPARWAGFQVLDVANPSAPKVIGFYNPLAASSRMAVVGRYAYIAEGGMHIVDVANPTNPINVGAYGAMDVADVVVAGHYAYLATFELGLRVVDVANPATPVEVGTLDTPESATGIAVQGSLAYVADRTSLQIVDVANPKKPRRLGVVSMPPYTQAVQVAGSYAYVGAQGGLQVVDITNPTAPQITGVYRLPETIFNYDLAIAGDYAYLATSKGLRIVNISNPRAPYEVDSFSLPDASSSINSVTVADGYAYIAAQGYGLLVLDISRPAAPRQVGGYAATSAYDVAVADGALYLSAGGQGFFVLGQRYAVAGQVIDGMGRPVAGVEVATSPGKTTTTDASGAYHFANLTSGTYMLTPSSPGYTFLPASSTVTVPPEASSQIFTMLPAPVSLTLTPGITSSLAYTDTQGLPMRLSFPAGVVSQTTLLTVTPTLGGQLPHFAFAGHAFDLTATRNGQLVPDLVFSQPVSVTVRYSDADMLVSEDEGKLMLWWLVGSNGRDATQSCEPPSAYVRDPAHNTLSVAICRGGAFSLFGPTNQFFFPNIAVL